MHYTISKVHGHFYQMLQLIEKIEEDDSDATFIFLGDIIDIGPQVDITIEWMMNNITFNGKYQCIKGEREQKIEIWYKRWTHWYFADWNINDCPMPHSFYGEFENVLFSLNKKTPQEMKPYIDFFNSLPCTKELRIVHNHESKNYRICYNYKAQKRMFKREEQNKEYFYIDNSNTNYLNILPLSALCVETLEEII